MASKEKGSTIAVNPVEQELGRAAQSSEKRTASLENTSDRRSGVTIQRYFTKMGVHPFDEITWELRTATIINEKGEVNCHHYQ